METMRGRAVVRGRAEGLARVSEAPIGFLGGVDPETGVVVERGHPLEGESVAGRVLVFPQGKGSTVGSYTIYRLARAGMAPAAIVNAESEAIVAVGALAELMNQGLAEGRAANLMVLVRQRASWWAATVLVALASTRWG